MKKLNSYTLATAIFCMTTIIMSCSKDDISPSEQLQGETTGYDQVDWFQDSIVETDSLGNFVQRVSGVPLDPANDTELYIGVSDLDAAITEFKSWLSPDTDMEHTGTDSAEIKVELKDTAGEVQEIVSFKALDNNPILAEVTFEKGTVIKFVSKVIFIKESAWPDNDESEYIVGDLVTLDTFNEGKQPWVCIKTARKGESGMLMYISKNKYRGSRPDSGHFATLSSGTAAHNELKKNWDSFVAFFKEAGMTLDDRYFWTDSWQSYIVYDRIWGIRLTDGDKDWFNYTWKDHKLPYIQIKTFGLE